MVFFRSRKTEKQKEDSGANICVLFNLGNIKKKEIKKMEEIKEKELKELEKLTIDELEEKEKKLREELELYECETNRKRRAVGTAIRANRIIYIYEKGGFCGLYRYIDKFRSYPGPEEKREYIGEDDIPF